MEEIERLESNESEKKDPKNIKMQETQVKLINKQYENYFFLILKFEIKFFSLEKNQHYKRTEDFL